jgi:flagellar motility protein MotE (MotC chaperone)
MQMKIIALVSSILRPVRFLVAAFTCALLLLSNAFPAFAIDSYQSNPEEATTQLLETQRKTDEIAKSAPPGLKKVQEESNKGLNEVQGDADINKMKRPSNSTSSTSVEDEVENFLEKVTGKK